MYQQKVTIKQVESMTNLVIKGTPKDYVIDRVSYADFSVGKLCPSTTEDYIWSYIENQVNS